MLQLACRHGIGLPITEVVVNVLHGRLSTSQATAQFMEWAPEVERYTPDIS
ncbi:hypothetical protein ACFXD5_07960 [Streptomyces sp. NPDC059385]|uniref:hypothetical protein n=1 Tax=Streptomyces sp. NPDC059385 TaxID=3346817 RepID=UPI00367C1ED2